jgi:hypothetical protein
MKLVGVNFIVDGILEKKFGIWDRFWHVILKPMAAQETGGIRRETTMMGFLVI